MNDTEGMTRAQAWVTAARPHTLPAAASPVIVGTGLAVHEGVFAPIPAIAALVGAGLIQIGTNLANDYYDARKGTDEGAEGFTRVTQSGLIAPKRVKRATYATFLLAMGVGLYLVYIGGVPILVVGLASIASGILYTGGPYPFGYHGLGDLFTFVFFGLVAVTGTYYVQVVAAGPSFPLWMPAGSVPFVAIVASLPMAALITNILVVNNVRDMETDRAAGKRTLAVFIGYRGSRAEFVAMLLLAYIVPLWFVSIGYSPWVLLPLITLPYAISITRTILRRTSADVLNTTLERTGRLTAGYAITFAIGFGL